MYSEIPKKGLYMQLYIIILHLYYKKISMTSYKQARASQATSSQIITSCPKQDKPSGATNGKEQGIKTICVPKGNKSDKPHDHR